MTVLDVNLKNPFPITTTENQDFQGQNLCFHHRFSFEIKVPKSPSSEGNSYKMVDAFTQFVALNLVSYCNASYGLTTLYEHQMG